MLQPSAAHHWGCGIQLQADPMFGTVVVLSPLDNFKATSAGPGKAADGVTPAYAPGTLRPTTVVSLHVYCLLIATQEDRAWT